MDFFGINDLKNDIYEKILLEEIIGIKYCII
jgi:hypothetical protein